LSGRCKTKTKDTERRLHADYCQEATMNALQEAIHQAALDGTDQSVFDGIAAGAAWADPRDAYEITNWPALQASAAIWFKVVDGRPVNPEAPTGRRYGRNECGHWGEALAADALVIVHLRVSRLRAVWRWLTRRPTTVRYVLMIEREDGHGWALPGGHVDPKDKVDAEDKTATYIKAAARELWEETGLELPGASWTAMEPRYVPDPRASDEAWMVTAPCTVDLGIRNTSEFPSVVGNDDAARAAWVPADTYDTLTKHLADVYDGTVFPAHVDMLLDMLRSL
jgi:ADP-ribose pyrophosphatase